MKVNFNSFLSFLILFLFLGPFCTGLPCGQYNSFQNAETLCIQRSDTTPYAECSDCFTFKEVGEASLLNSIVQAPLNNHYSGKTVINQQDRVNSTGGVVTSISFAIATNDGNPDNFIRFCPVISTSEYSSGGLTTGNFRVTGACEEICLAYFNNAPEEFWYEPNGITLQPNGYLAVQYSTGVVPMVRNDGSVNIPFVYISSQQITTVNVAFTATTNPSSASTRPIAIEFELKNTKPFALPSCDNNYCHWESAFETCASNLPVTCSGYVIQQNCEHPSNPIPCSWDVDRGICFETGDSICENYNAEGVIPTDYIGCLVNSNNCHLDYTSVDNTDHFICTSNNPNTTSLTRCSQHNAANTSANCPNDCYLDNLAYPGGSLCFDNAVQAASITYCPSFSWSETACDAHECQWSSISNQCYIPGQLPVEELELDMRNVGILPNSPVVTQGVNGPILSFTITVSGLTFNPFNQDLKALGLGVYNLLSLGDPNYDKTPSHCFTSDFTRVLQTWPQHEDNRADLINARTSQFNSGDLDYPPGIGQDMDGVFTVGGISPVDSVSWVSGVEHYHVTLDLFYLQTRCPGVSRNTTSDSLVISTQVTWLTKLYDPTNSYGYRLFVSPFNFVISQARTGQFEINGVTSIADYEWNIVSTSFLPINIIENRYIQQVIIEIRYHSDYNSSYLVLPRSVNDFRFSDVPNCYGDQVVLWQPISYPCVNGICIGTLVINSEERVCNTSNCFASCNQEPVGGNPLDTIHQFTMTAYACRYDNDRNIIPSSCVAPLQGLFTDIVRVEVEELIVLGTTTLSGPEFNVALEIYPGHRFNMSLNGTNQLFQFVNSPPIAVALPEFLQNTIAYTTLSQGSTYTIEFTELTYTGVTSGDSYDFFNPTDALSSRIQSPQCNNVFHTGSCDAFKIRVRDLVGVTNDSQMRARGKFILSYFELLADGNRRLLSHTDNEVDWTVIVVDASGQVTVVRTTSGNTVNTRFVDAIFAISIILLTFCCCWAAIGAWGRRKNGWSKYNLVGSTS